MKCRPCRSGHYALQKKQPGRPIRPALTGKTVRSKSLPLGVPIGVACCLLFSGSVVRGQPADDLRREGTRGEQSAVVDAPESAAAEPPFAVGQDEGEDWLRATGDWFGARSDLEKNGITLEATTSVDAFANVRGGRNTHDSVTYRALFDLSLSLDTQALGLWDGGTLFLDFQVIRGESISSRHVDDLLALDNVDAPSRSQLSEYWFEQMFGDERWRLKLGKQDANADFGASDYAGEFLNSAAGLIPNIPMPTYPDPALGTAVFYTPVEWLQIGAGLFDADGDGTRSGFETAFHGSADSFSVVELTLRPTLRLSGQGLPGAYRVGGWYHGGEWDVFINDLGGRLPPRTHRGNAGLYLVFDQLLYRECPEDETDEQGLGAYFQFGWAPGTRNEIGEFYGGGFQYTGLVPNRDSDVTGIAVEHANLADGVSSFEDRHSETAVEWFYKFQWSEFFSINSN